MKSRLPKRLNALALCLATYAEKFGMENVRPAVTTLAEDLGVTRQCVQMGLAELRANGILIALELGGGKGRATRYRFQVQALPTSTSQAWQRPTSTKAEPPNQLGGLKPPKNPHANRQNFGAKPPNQLGPTRQYEKTEETEEEPEPEPERGPRQRYYEVASEQYRKFGTDHRRR